MSVKPSWMPSLNALRALDAVARHSSFQKAADELHVSSPAVQQLVRLLEEAVGQPLVISRNRKLSLSEAAASASPLLRAGFENIASAVGEMRSYARPKGIKVSVEPSFAAGWLLYRLNDFQLLHPDIDVFIEASLRLADLDRDADIAIRYKTAENGHYVSQQLFEDETIAVCAPALLSTVGNALSSSRDKSPALPLIHFESPRRIGLQPDWKSWLASAQIQMDIPPKGLRFSDYNMVLQSAIAGQGLALASRPLVQDSIKSGLLADALTKGVKNGFGYYVMTTRVAEARPEVDAFIKWLVDVVKACNSPPSENR